MTCRVAKVRVDEGESENEPRVESKDPGLEEAKGVGMECKGGEGRRREACPSDTLSRQSSQAAPRLRRSQHKEGENQSG